jgi:hypothetical protein
VSMQTPPPAAKSKRGLVIGGLAVLGAALVGGGLFVLRSTPGSSVAASPSSSIAEAPSGVTQEPPSARPVSSEAAPAPPTPLAIASEKAQPPLPAPSAAQSAPATLRSAPVPAGVKPGRAEERGLAKDNPFK